MEREEENSNKTNVHCDGPDALLALRDHEAEVEGLRGSFGSVHEAPHGGTINLGLWTAFSLNVETRGAID